MPNIYKVREHTPDGNVVLYHSSADVVMFDESKAPGLGNSAEDAIVALNKKAEGKANTSTLETTIVASAFTGVNAPYKQTIKVEGILETDNPIAGVVFDDDMNIALQQRDAWGSVHRIACGNGEITVYCYEDKPIIDIPIQLKIVR